MHSFKLGNNAHAHFNGDFSGDISITQGNGDGSISKVEFPINGLKDLIAEVLKSNLISKIEQSTASDIFTQLQKLDK